MTRGDQAVAAVVAMSCNNVNASGASPQQAPGAARHLKAGDLHELGDVNAQLDRCRVEP